MDDRVIGEAARRRGDPRAGLGLAFEGCACRAAFHVGAIEWLAEHDMMPCAVAGASSGAVIAAATAVGRVAELRPVWAELFGNRVCSFRRLLRGRWPFRMSEIVGSVANRYFGNALIADTRIPLSIVITELRSNGFSRRALTARDPVSIARAVLASCFIPGPYSRMVPIDGRATFDGAWLGRVPVLEAAELGARRVIACVSDDAGRLLRGAFRPTAMTLPSGLDYRVLSPVEPLPIRAFDFDRGATLATFAIGRASAEAFAARNLDWLISCNRRPPTSDLRPPTSDHPDPGTRRLCTPESTLKTDKAVGMT